MADNLQESGIKWISAGDAAFQKSIQAGAKAIAAMNKVTEAGGKLLSTLGRALGNVAQIALGILTRDLLRGIVRGVSAMFKEAAENIFGSADALKKLKDNAGKAAESLPDLRTQLGLAKLKLAEMNQDSKASATDLAEQAVAVRKLEGELSAANSTVREAEIAQHKYNESLAGQAEAFRGKLVEGLQNLIARYLPALTSAFQRLSPIILNLARQFFDFLANPVFLAKAQQLVDWFSTSLPLALNNASKAIQPVIDILFGSGSWQDKLKALGQIILDWFEGMVPIIVSRLRMWNEAFTAWVVEQGSALAVKIRDVWGPAFVDWIGDPATQQRAGQMLGNLAAWLLDQGMKAFSAIAQSIGQLFLSVLNVGVNGAGANSASTMVGTFLKSFWDAFSKSYVWQLIAFQLQFTWDTIRVKARHAWLDIVDGITIVLAQASVAIMNAWFKISEFIRDIFLDIRDHGIDKFNKLKDFFTRVHDQIYAVFAKAWGDVHFLVLSKYYDLENKLKLAWSLFAGDVKRAWEKITAPVVKAWNDVIGFLTDPKKRQELFDAGINWIKGFIDGLKQKAWDLYNSARDIFSKVIQTIRDILGMHSPSTLGLAMGENFGASFGLGMQGALSGAMSGLGLEALATVAPPAAGSASYYNYSSSTTDSRQFNLNLTSPAPANVQGSFAMMQALASGV